MTESITIGVMLKDNTDVPEDMHGWKMCNAGVHKISGFLHPMGWLLANDTIKRSSSPLKSIALVGYFDIFYIKLSVNNKMRPHAQLRNIMIKEEEITKYILIKTLTCNRAFILL